MADYNTFVVVDCKKKKPILTRTQRGKKRFDKEFENAQNEYKNARNKAKEEYKKLVDSGKIKPKTKIEKILKNAHGHEDLQSTQASRRLAKKRGYDWKTGKKL